MNCPRCGKRVKMAEDGSYVCLPCQDARLRAIILDRIRDAVIERAGKDEQQQRKGG